MTDKNILALADEAEEKSSRATEGPWQVSTHIERRGCAFWKTAKISSLVRRLKEFPSVKYVVLRVETWYALPEEADLEFIAWAREGVPRLAGVLREQVEEVKNLRDGFRRANAQESLLWHIKGELEESVTRLKEENERLREVVRPAKELAEAIRKEFGVLPLPTDNPDATFEDYLGKLAHEVLSALTSPTPEAQQDKEE